MIGHYNIQNNHLLLLELNLTISTIKNKKKQMINNLKLTKTNRSTLVRVKICLTKDQFAITKCKR